MAVGIEIVPVVLMLLIRKDGMSYKLNRKLLIFNIFFYIFLFGNVLEKIIPFLGYVDELIALSAIPLAVAQLYTSHFHMHTNRLGEHGYLRYVLLYVLCGLLANLLFGYQNIAKAALPDLLLNAKFWLVIYAGKCFFRNFDIHKWADRILYNIQFVICLYTVLIVIDNIHPIFYSEIRYGFRSTQLFYSHPTIFAANCVLLMAILLIIRNDIGSQKTRNMFIWISVMICSTLRSKMFGCVFAFWLIYYFVFYRQKKLRLRTMVLFIPLVLALGWNQIEYYFFSGIQQESARYQLLAKSFEIAKDHFPIGAGFGTFASYYSGLVYSPLYSKYGISGVWGLTKGNTTFISDSYWPMILAQFGWIGLLANVMAILNLFRQIQKIRKISHCDYAVGLFILAYLLIESTAASAFVHPLSMPLALLLGHVLSSTTRLNKKILN